MNVFFTGCTHFEHANIIKLANRPFEDVEQMNETLVERWNEKVKPSDRVYHLGDVAWGNVSPWMTRLNGQKIVILGNHDERSQMELAGGGIKQVLDYAEIKAGGSRFVLFHYPIEDWNGRWRGSIHLHCHTHSSQFFNPSIPRVEGSALSLPDPFPPDVLCNRFNVGVDACGFTPVSLDEVIGAATKLTIDT